jgi:hypothetical protein
MAQIMKAREWQRITRMAEMAESHDYPGLALAVYEACFGAGIHQGFLRQKYEQLKARIGSD